ncbi:MAG: rod shape-determining protein MreC [Bacteroidia bacterium]|jgi:rod shape-determining protein MreC
MKNILLFIYRNHVFFVFLFLELVCFSLIVRNNNFHRGSALNSSNQLVGSIYDFNNGITDYFHLKSINDDLAVENAVLRSLLADSKYISSRKAYEKTDSVARQKYTYVPAKVVNNSIDRRSNYLTINRGILHGVEPEMAVLSSDGIVGIVKDVSKNYASVISVVHKNSSISVKLAESGYIGSLVWDGADPQTAQLMDIPNHVELEAGMQVQTSGYSSMFPNAISVGEVKSFEIKEGDNFYSIDVSLNTNMNSVSMVYVVNNLMKIEQKELEKQTQVDDN